MRKSNGGVGTLTGVDTTVKVDDHTQVKAEIATSKTNECGIDNDGSAYLTEVSHRSDKMDGKAYVREQSNGFGLGQQNNSETGTRKVGAEVELPARQTLELWAGKCFSRTFLPPARCGTWLNFTANTLQANTIFWQGSGAPKTRSLRGKATGPTSFSQVRNTSLPTGSRCASAAISLLSRTDNVDYPTQTTVGADYKLSDSSTFFADQEWTQGSGLDTETSRIGIKASPWTGGQIGSTMEQQTTENGVRLFSTTGLKQSWQVTKKWSVDAGLDRSTTLRNTSVSTDGSTAPYIFNTNVPPAVGATEDFTAVSLGAGYREEKWSWTARVEDRVSTSEDKFGVFMGANGEAQKGLGLAAVVQAFKTSAASGTEQFNSDLRLSLGLPSCREPGHPP